MATYFSNKWLVLGIDLFTIAVSFFLAYLIRFNLSMSFSMSKLTLQLPMVVLIVLMAFLITGSYKGLFEHSGAQDVYKVFRAIGLSSLLLFGLMVINHTWQVSPEFNIPFSIIIIYSLLSIVGLTASHFVIKVFYNALVNKTSKK